MSTLEWLVKHSEVKRDGRAERATDEEIEERVNAKLSADEKVFVSRYPNICAAFDSGSYGFIDGRGFWPDGVPFRVAGIPAGAGYLIARKIARRVIELVRAAGRTAIVSSGTYRFKSFEEAQVALDTAKRNNVCRIVLITIHGKDHAHILHDCPLSHGACKCFSGFIPKRGSAHKHFIGELSETRIAKIVFYFFNCEKWIYYFKIGEARFTSTISAAAQNDRLATSRREGLDCEGILEGCDDETGLLLQSDESGSSEGDIPSGSEDKRQRVGRSTKRKAEREGLADIVYRKLGLIMCSPIKDFSRTSRWFNDSFLRNIKPTKEEVQVAFNRLTFELQTKTLKQFKEFYQIAPFSCEEDSKYLFGCLNENHYWNHYFDKMESVIWLKKLLIWQFAPTSINSSGKVLDKNWKEEVFKFIKFVMLMLDRKTGKKNTIYILSPPNAGKTLLMDCIADYFVSVGHLKVWNRTSSFPLEELDGARVAFMNEPNIESGNYPECLKLLGGDNLSIAIKYNRPSTVQHVPVFITSNYQKLPTTPEFNERITYYRWTARGVIESVGKKRLHPYALGILFTECENYYEEEIRV